MRSPTCLSCLRYYLQLWKQLKLATETAVALLKKRSRSAAFARNEFIALSYSQSSLEQ